MFRWTLRIFQATKFASYGEIGNVSRGKIEMMRKAPKDDWIACEKVHGSNFGVYMLVDASGNPSFSYSKRSGMLRYDEDFFGFQCLTADLEKHATHAREQLEKVLGVTASGVLLNGELFGGKYKHPQVPASTQIARVGKRVLSIQPPQKDDFPQYTPNLTFYAFDLKYKVNTDESWVRCTFDEMTAVYEKIPNLLYAKPVVRGNLDTVLAFDVENFQTTIPAQLGLGDFPLVDNWAEGLVVRNVDFGNRGSEDLMFKWKAARFQEIRHKDQIFEDPLAVERALALKKVGVQLPRPETVFPKKEQCDALQLLLDHVVKTRLDNLISKIGPEPILKGEETQESLAKLLARDALKDFLKDRADYAIVNTPLVYRREMSFRCLFEARLLVKKEWDGILKGFSADKARAEPSPAK